MTYAVKIEQFEGPLPVLLSMIEEKRLEVTAVNLASVTGDFLTYVQGLSGLATPTLLAEFVVVAAQLILIKSKALLPSLPLTGEEEQSIEQLEHRLLLYRAYRAAVEALRGSWPLEPRSFARPFFMEFPDRNAFYPPPGLMAEGLARTVDALIVALKTTIPATGTVKRVMISLEEKTKELLRRVASVARESFRGMTERKSRAEVVVFFLAILHLFRERLLSAEQAEPFGDILFEKNDVQ